ncbi:hypothetical protein RRG08_010807 [Elysia crispata]|uniref:Uncharacterized protein n=1 Tax=Elysia crispata TaxID=231223 RepID=A0AAE1DF30_9GAST|nr:hypothetical protein RRG08_010807 [Elysia crispata]
MTTGYTDVGKGFFWAMSYQKFDKYECPVTEDQRLVSNVDLWRQIEQMIVSSLPYLHKTPHLDPLPDVSSVLIPPPLSLPPSRESSPYHDHHTKPTNHDHIEQLTLYQDGEQLHWSRIKAHVCKWLEPFLVGINHAVAADNDGASYCQESEGCELFRCACSSHCHTPRSSAQGQEKTALSCRLVIPTAATVDHPRKSWGLVSKDLFIFELR